MQCFNTEITVHRNRYPMGQHFAADTLVLVELDEAEISLSVLYDSLGPALLVFHSKVKVTDVNNAIWQTCPLCACPYQRVNFVVKKIILTFAFRR